MDSFNSSFNPNSWDDNSSADESRSKSDAEEKRKAKEAEEAEKKAKLKAKAEKEKDEESKPKSIFSFKKKADEAVKEAQDRAPKDKKKDPRHIVEAISEDEDHFSESERLEIQQNSKKIIKRAKQISEASQAIDSNQDEEAGGISRQEGVKLNTDSNPRVEYIPEDEALSLAVAEILSGDDELDIDYILSLSKEDHESEVVESGSETADPEDEGPASLKAILDKMKSSGEHGADIDSSENLPGETDAESGNEKTSISIEDINPENEAKKVKKKSAGRSLLGLLALKPRKKVSSRASFGSGFTQGTGSGPESRPNPDLGINNNHQPEPDQENRFNLSDALSFAVADRMIKLKGDSAEQQINNGASNNSMNTPDTPRAEYVRKVAAKSDDLRLDIEQERDFYVRRPSGEIVDHPVEIERERAVYESSNHVQNDRNPTSFHQIEEYQPVEIADRPIINPLDQTELAPESAADKQLIPNNASNPEYRATLTGKPEISKMTIAQFERYLEGIALHKKPKNAKQLSKYVKKDIGRYLSLVETRNLEHFWQKKQAEVLSKNPDIMGPDPRVHESNERILESTKATGHSSAQGNSAVQQVHSAQSNNVAHDVRLNTSSEDNKQEPKSKPVAVLPPGSAWNFGALILMIAILAYVIAYAIILIS